MPVFLTSLLTNAKLWIGILILAAVGAGFIYVKHVQDELALSQANLKTEQANEVTLKGTISQLTAAQAQDQLVIQQVTSDKQAALDAVSALNTSLNTSAQQIGTLKSQLNNITAKPTNLTPFLVQAIQGVQAQQASRAAAPVGASQ